MRRTPRAAAAGFLLSLAAVLLPATGAFGQAAEPVATTALPPAEIEARIDALLSRMNLDEKVGQLTLVSAGSTFDPEMVRAGRIGAVMNFGLPEETAAVRRLAAQSRLKIPPLIMLDVVHGYRTLLPIPLAEAATFDTELAFEGAKWTAREAALAGVDFTFGPMADLSRDIRWGRIVEGAGEDPVLLSAFTSARVRGYRAGGLGTSTKHFVAYGAPVGGRDYDAVSVGPSELRDVYLPPFRAAVEAGTDSVMTAFMTIDGLPVAANPHLLQDVLRGELGFEGFVLSDYNVAGELMNHGITDDPTEAVRIAFTSGVDMEMVGGLYGKHLAREVTAGRVPVAAVDAAVRRVLRAKFRLGLFDTSRPAPLTSGLVAPLPEVRSLARRMAAESMVLLQNRHAVLPIGPATRRIAVIGPLAESRRDLNGPHEARAVMEDTTTFVEGLTARAGQNGATVSYAPGCDDLYCNGLSGLETALQAARDSDLVVAVAGEPRDLTGEGGSRARMSLPGRQYELLFALAGTGKPVVLVLLGGRPLELGGLLDRIPAVLMAWYPGTEAGPALADILFGDVNPSGRLPHTWPRTIGQVPIHYDRTPTGRPTQHWHRFTVKYVDEPIAPQFPFGFGLSYTNFVYSDLRILTPEVNRAGELVVEARLFNTGPRDGREVVQLYVRDPVASLSRPLRQLKAFRKVALAAGASEIVQFRIPARDLGFHRPDGSYVVEPGAFHVWIGGSSDATLSGEFKVVE